MPIPKITGYPDFTRLADQEAARQFKLAWDALKALSDGIASLTLPDTTQISLDVVTLSQLVQAQAREVAAARLRIPLARLRVAISATRMMTLGSTPLSLLPAKAAVCYLPAWIFIYKAAGAYTISATNFYINWLSTPPIQASSLPTTGFMSLTEAAIAFRSYVDTNRVISDTRVEDVGGKALELTFQGGTNPTGSPGGAVTFYMVYYEVPVSPSGLDGVVR